MDQPFIGMINAFGFNYAPRDWMFCNGAHISISQYTTLYALISNFYGGDGRVSFAVPDLRARVPVGSTIMGVSPTVPGAFYPLGFMSGWTEMALNENHMAIHSHAATFTPAGGGGAAEVQVSQNTGNSKSPSAGSYLASAPALGTTFDLYVDDANKGTTVALGGVSGGGSSTGVVTVQNSGSSQAFSILNPVTAINYSIALDGLFPSRS